MKFFLHVACLCSLLFLTGCDLIWTSMTINYKVTVEIETPEGVKSGYAVRQISSYKPLLPFPGERGTRGTFRGEAVVIDLGKRGKVFALLSDRKGLYQAFPIKGPATEKGIQHFKSLKIGEKAEWTNFKPMFVMFKDIKDPTSITLLRDEEHWDRDLGKSTASDHFEYVLGQGIHLKRMTVEITNQPVTDEIGKLLIWLPDFYNKMFDGRKINTIKAENKLANSTSSAAFKKGKTK